jgi:hypothetical protein
MESEVELGFRFCATFRPIIQRLVETETELMLRRKSSFPSFKLLNSTNSSLPLLGSGFQRRTWCKYSKFFAAFHLLITSKIVRRTEKY